MATSLSQWNNCQNILKAIKKTIPIIWLQNSKKSQMTCKEWFKTMTTKIYQIWCNSNYYWTKSKVCILIIYLEGTRSHKNIITMTSLSRWPTRWMQMPHLMLKSRINSFINLLPLTQILLLCTRPVIQIKLKCRVSICTRNSNRSWTLSKWTIQISTINKSGQTKCQIMPM